MKSRILLAIFSVLTLASFAQAQSAPSIRGSERVQKEVRHELLMLP